MHVRESVRKVACGDSHTMIIETDTDSVLVCGANDRFQLGDPNLDKEYILYEFEEVPALKNVEAAEVRCWNFSAVIDRDHNLWLWGVLHDKNRSLAIKQPEKAPNLKVDQIEIGGSMAVAIEKRSRRAYVIGTTVRNELGVGDTNARKSFVSIDDIKDKQIELVAVGKSGYVVAIGQLQQSEEQLNNSQKQSQNQSMSKDRIELQQVKIQPDLLTEEIQEVKRSQLDLEDRV